MADMWSGIGNYFQNLADKSLEYEREWQNYLYPDMDTAASSTAAGYGSNIRHSAASSALSNIIENKMHKMFATPGYEDQKPSRLFDWMGKVGAFFPMTAHEIPQDNTYSLAYESDPWNQVSPGHPSGRYNPDLNPLPPKKNWWQNQFTEDMLANLFGIVHGGESEDPNVEAQTLKPKLAYNKGIINNALLNIAKERGYSTRYDLQSELEQPNIIIPHRKEHTMKKRFNFPSPLGQFNRMDRIGKSNYPGSNDGTIKVTEANQNNFAAGQVPRRVKAQDFTRTKYGKAYNTGGIVSLVL